MSHAEAEALARDWFRALDVHAPLADVRKFLHHSNLRMVFPEATLTSIEEFDAWYEGVIRIFFDEAHEHVTVAPLDEDGHYAVTVEWSAHTWDPPAARSAFIHMLAKQTWQVLPDDAGELRIRDYVVDALEPFPDHDER